MDMLPSTAVRQAHIITSFGQMNGVGGGMAFSGSSAVWPSANLAVYMPVCVQIPCIITKFFSHNGTVASGNIDIGLYTNDGCRLISTGSTAQSGTSVVQSVDVTDTLIGAGIYYIAMAMDNTTGTVIRVASNANLMRLHGMYQQASAFALPATATFATPSTNWICQYGALLSPRTVI